MAPEPGTVRPAQRAELPPRMKALSRAPPSGRQREQPLVLAGTVRRKSPLCEISDPGVQRGVDGRDALGSHPPDRSRGEAHAAEPSLPRWGLLFRACASACRQNATISRCRRADKSLRSPDDRSAFSMRLRPGRAVEGVPEHRVVYEPCRPESCSRTSPRDGAEGPDAGLDVGPPRIGECLRGWRVGQLLEAKPPWHAEPAELDVDIRRCASASIDCFQRGKTSSRLPPYVPMPSGPPQ